MCGQKKVPYRLSQLAMGDFADPVQSRGLRCSDVLEVRAATMTLILQLLLVSLLSMYFDAVLAVKVGWIPAMLI
jgi:hypothetical protein